MFTAQNGNIVNNILNPKITGNLATSKGKRPNESMQKTKKYIKIHNVINFQPQKGSRSFKFTL